MILTVDYLKERHQYWAKYLFDKKIFEHILDLIPLEIHYGVKTLNGCFRYNGKLRKIILYPITNDVNSQWVDSVLVHEMIHQYIFDSKIKDTSPHGRFFKHYMARINFLSVVKIKITDNREVIYQNEEGNELHNICVLKFNDSLFLCKVKYNKVNYFNSLILSNKMKWKSPLLGFGWFQTKHVHFINQRASNTRLTGIVFKPYQLQEVIQKYKLQKFEVIENL